MRLRIEGWPPVDLEPTPSKADVNICFGDIRVSLRDVLASLPAAELKVGGVVNLSEHDARRIELLVHTLRAEEQV